MPQLMPTHEELANLPAHKRERIRRAIVRILNDVDDLAGREIERLTDAREFGEQVRDAARVLELTITRDDDETTYARRKALLEAIS